MSHLFKTFVCTYFSVLLYYLEKQITSNCKYTLRLISCRYVECHKSNVTYVLFTIKRPFPSTTIRSLCYHRRIGRTLTTEPQKNCFAAHAVESSSISAIDSHAGICGLVLAGVLGETNGTINQTHLIVNTPRAIRLPALTWGN